MTCQGWQLGSDKFEVTLVGVGGLNVESSQ
jgi:hypothetical protein